ncbi:MAG: MFS transporter [Pseudomonadota bacterium]
MTELLTRNRLMVLACAGAVVTANAYYVHPIVGPIAAAFAVSDGWVGAVPATNQIALALGVLLLLPLGDRVSNRRLVFICLAAQTLALLVMALATDFRWFLAGSTVLGFFTVTPYLLPAYASKRVPRTQLGAVTALLTTGVIAGVLLSRTGSGVVAEYFGWRSVYGLATGLMVLATFVVPTLMDDELTTAVSSQPSYPALLGSLVTLIGRNPDVVLSGAIQGLSFATFLAMWLGIGLHFTSADVGLGTAVVGYLSAFSALNLLTTPRLGRWADRVGAQSARLRMTLVQVLGALSLLLSLFSLWWLLVPIALTSVAGPMIDTGGRMTFLAMDPAIRTRLMSVYITLMFVGGGLGSWAGTWAYGQGGWVGTVAMTLATSATACALAALAYRRSWRAANQLPV